MESLNVRNQPDANQLSALDAAKRFCREVAKNKQVYTYRDGSCLVSTTNQERYKDFVKRAKLSRV